MLRIKEWHKNFETERTATFKRRQQLDFSTDINGMSLVWLLNNHDNGPVHFAVWILICEWYASTTPPREGWITHNGKKTGVPLGAKDLASIIHISENHVEEALKRLSQPPISWITVERSVARSAARSGQAASPIPSYPTPPHLTSPKRKRREYPAEFERLWKIHSQGGKINAFKAMEKLKPDKLELNKWVEKLEAYKLSHQWKNGYAQNLSTWINGGFFDGEVPKDPPPPPETEMEKYERLRDAKP